MIKNQTQTLLTGLIIYSLYIWGFHYCFEPVHYGVFFYVTAFCYAMGFYCKSYSQVQKTDFARATISKTTDKYTNNTLEQTLYALYLKNPSGYTSPPKEPTTPIWDMVHTVGDWYDIVADVIHHYHHPVYRNDFDK